MVHEVETSQYLCVCQRERAYCQRRFFCFFVSGIRLYIYIHIRIGDPAGMKREEEGNRMMWPLLPFSLLGS